MPVPLRCLFALTCLFFVRCAQATEVRIAVPAACAGDVFINSLLSSKILLESGLTPAPQKTIAEQDVTRALKTGAADVGVFTLPVDDSRTFDAESPEASLLVRPFMFKSTEEVFSMQKSFLADAAASAAGRTGLFPLKLWNHAITYFLTEKPMRSMQDFSGLTVARDNGAPDMKILSSIGAKAISSASFSDALSQGQANAIETQLGAQAQDLVSRYKGKLFLTFGWPEARVLIVSPKFWMQRTEAEKNALRTAAQKAREAADDDLRARVERIRRLSNVEINELDQDEQMKLAMRAAGRDPATFANEMDLWRRAELEVHAAQAASTNAPRTEPKSGLPRNSPVFFATDRNDEGTLDYTTRFGARRTYPFEFTCGFLGAPARHSGEPKLPPAPRTLAKSKEECARLIVAKAKESGLNKILFVIHGFNTGFDGLAWRALQLGSELDYDGVIVGWSWPSENSAFGYGYDADSSAWSEPHLLGLVNEIFTIAPELKFDFVAHSMGNRMLLQMLRELVLLKSNIRVGAAVFAAPDVAQDLFREQVRSARKIGALLTLYASAYDRDILISESFHNAPRAGSGGVDILVVGGVETVDARLSGHSYVFDEPKAVRDFQKVVNEDEAARARGLEAQEKAGATYWVIEP